MKQCVITALDVGSFSIKAIISQVLKDGRIEVKGTSQVETEGIERGLVRDIATVSASIKKALEEVETLSGLKAQNIYVNITGDHIRTSTADGRISIPSNSSSEPGEITAEHLEQVIEESRNIVKVQKSNDRCRILHSFPQSYSIDNHEDIINPINMNGFLLVARVCSVFAEITPLRNLSKCIELAGYHVDQDNFVLNHIAVANAVLSDDEKRLGCILMDFGAGTCDISIFNKRIMDKILVIPKAGSSITEDIAIGLKTPISYAEYIKQEYGSANVKMVDPTQDVEIEGISGRAGTRKAVALISHVIQHRVDDILSLCYNKTKEHYTTELVTAGIVLTGGTSKLRHMDSIVEYSFNLPVKLASPNLSRFTGQLNKLDDPSYSCAVGLLLHAACTDNESKSSSNISFDKLHNNKIVDKIKKIFNDFIQ